MLTVFATVVLAGAMSAGCIAAQGVPPLRRLEVDAQSDDSAYLFVGYKSIEDKGAILQHDQLVCRHEFDKVGALAVMVSKNKVQELKADPHVAYVEEDQIMYPDGEIVPYGISMTQMDSKKILRNTKLSSNGSTFTCSDSQSFKIGIVDSGIDAGHPDLPCRSQNDPQCIGNEFGLSGSERWFNPVTPHGTHVAGTIGAIGNNNLGVVGMVPDTTDVCYVIARVFGDGDGGARFSDILAGLQWAIDQGAQVINMSLGGQSYDGTAANLMKEYWNDGRLIVASAGNSGTGDYRYPASYENVISVAAIDKNEETATFSQYNDEVTVTAPGVGILSTLPMASSEGIITVSAGGNDYLGSAMQYSEGIPKNGIKKNLFFCGNFAKNGCDGAGGMVCLVKRGGGLTFEEKGQACEKAGAVAVIVYNDESGSFQGQLAEDTEVSIPVLSLDEEQGEDLRVNFQGSRIEITQESGYGFMSGTSMSAPHVTGAIAALWRACPDCRNNHILACLQETAKDLGDKGRDDVFGAGLIQTQDAFKCLTDRCCSPARRELGNELDEELIDATPTSSRVPTLAD